jgi:hypothetical protein
MSNGVNWEHQGNEVIAKELMLALIQEGKLDSEYGHTFAEIVGEMYNKILETIDKPRR